MKSTKKSPNPNHREQKKGGGAHLDVAGHCLREGSGSSTTARPLDGGALTHRRTHAPARDTAAAQTPFHWLPRAATATAAPHGLALRKKGIESKRKNEYIDLGSKTTSNPNPRAKGGGYSPSAANTAGHRRAEKSCTAARRGAAQRGSAARRPGRRRYERARARGTAAKPLDGGALPHGRSARRRRGGRSVSYTHLTLPTILRV